MAPKKKSTEKKESFLEKITGSNFLGSILEILKIFTGDFVREFINTIEKKLLEIEKKIISNIFSGILILIAVVLFVIAAVQLLPQYIQMQKGMGSLIVGVIVLIWAFIIKNKNK